MKVDKPLSAGWMMAVGTLAATGLCAILNGGCTSRPGAAPTPPEAAATITPPEGRGLRPVTLPEFSRLNESARQQLQTRYASLTSGIANPRTPATELGAAYGEMGKLLQAATFFDAAEACYVNAETLAPTDRRWPYYLGHLYKVKGPLDNSVASFERALQMQPDDVANLVWLGDAYLAQGRADAAEPVFARALSLEPKSAAALFGAGRAALAKKNFALAVRQLEDALALDPRATAIHYPLAMAYRGRGDLGRAEDHLAKRGDVDTRPTDPLMRELDDLLESAEAYNVRGGRALEVGNWPLAADYFRKGLELAPADPSLRHRLGTALFQMGDARGAEEQFAQVVRTSPDFARAQFSLGVLLAGTHRHAEAIERFSAVLKIDPGYAQARVQLAGVLSRTGRAAEAVDHYKRVLEVEPANSDAQLGYGMTLIRLHRYPEAREQLTEGMKSHPEQPLFSHALARVLSAAPDDRVRDGRRAMKLVEELLKQQQSIELGETSAMTLAELGQYREAAAVQRNVMAAAEKAGLKDVLRRTAENLRLYERGQPCRTPFAEEEIP
jgi:tetratricopeptide (TPR) repeat protein